MFAKYLILREIITVSTCFVLLLLRYACSCSKEGFRFNKCTSHDNFLSENGLVALFYVKLSLYIVISLKIRTKKMNNIISISVVIEALLPFTLSGY